MEALRTVVVIHERVERKGMKSEDGGKEKIEGFRVLVGVWVLAFKPLPVYPSPLLLIIYQGFERVMHRFCK